MLDSNNKTMTAAILRELGGPLKLEQVPIPKPGIGEILIKVVACGVCHSDVHACDGDWPSPPNLPLIPGHEVTGHIAELGEGVTGYALGDTVGVPWMYSACGACEYCRAGMETICKQGEATGYSKPGGYAEYMIAPAAFVAKVPAGADLYGLAPILCAGVTTYRGLKRSGARPGQWMAVIGIGGLGHVAVQYAKAMGLRVVAVDVSDEKLELAHRLGAERVYNVMNDPEIAIHAELGGVHGVLVTATSNKAFELAVKLLRPGGTAIYIGQPGGAADEVRSSIDRIVNWELSIRGSNVGTRQDLHEAVEFAANGLVAVQASLTTLDEINEIFDQIRKGTVVGRKVLKIS
ncbi:alcohol dehydrogenase catalytic domain-containing protein [Pseudomonas auratipiscis]|uniref:alcohol dehydrogenase n=1 Tax=Pseudomonas auratipiscis TaxID=3115853 RepID=A0AB35WV80_9PSED|nr:MULTISPECIES: zinc-dependent alcohol dehydrogenase [unclassified Pseudomonas]MEE1868600.1 zinc-dependent alcohol dehydrogenase [Pseudomonas sp. 120P]MEE1959261.1 zinc-dependent alcohol dehydrogenase [Pseudomonas sp. 119P]